MSTYRRIPNEDQSYLSSKQGSSRKSRISQRPTVKSKTISERVTDKIHAAIWVGTAVAVGQYTSFFHVVLSDPDIIRPLFNIAVVLIGINTVLMLYLAVYLPRWKDIHNPDAWEIYCPRVIPSMTIIGLIASMLLIRSTWPIWGFLSPLILAIEALGALFFMHFVPWF